MEISEKTYNSLIKFIKEFNKEKPIKIKPYYKNTTDISYKKIEIAKAIQQIIENIKFKNKTYKEILEDIWEK